MADPMQHALAIAVVRADENVALGDAPAAAERTIADLKNDLERTQRAFTSVVDDLACKVSHILRGDDHITNTGVQIDIAEALGGSRGCRRGALWPTGAGVAAATQQAAPGLFRPFTLTITSTNREA